MEIHIIYQCSRIYTTGVRQDCVHRLIKIYIYHVTDRSHIGGHLRGHANIPNRRPQATCCSIKHGHSVYAANIYVLQLAAAYIWGLQPISWRLSNMGHISLSAFHPKSFHKRKRAERLPEA